ncbi:hypothetical protein C8R42DRAFT_713545 [Lentinula raphanica]|nr:hypothetical protein C8R42DRAFT_713545 [Lentinula raphanica]
MQTDKAFIYAVGRKVKRETEVCRYHCIGWSTGKNCKLIIGIDVENRAYWLTVTNQSYYAEEIEQEAAHELPDKKPPSPWPSQGHVKFDNVVLKYCPELPPVLKGISMDVRGGEKIGIAGRTGAGKSSLMSAIHQEKYLGSREPRDTPKSLGFPGFSEILKDFQRFSKQLRFGCYQHRRCGYSELIEDEGGNLSIGQRSLVSLAPGQIAEFDTPANLYQVTNGIFRSMCERLSITQDNIRIATKIREDDDAI